MRTGDEAGSKAVSCPEGAGEGSLTLRALRREGRLQRDEGPGASLSEVLLLLLLLLTTGLDLGFGGW